MESEAAEHDDVLEFLDRLTVADIEERLERLDAEQQSLRVLLRSLRARERTASSQKTRGGDAE